MNDYLSKHPEIKIDKHHPLHRYFNNYLWLITEINHLSLLGKIEVLLDVYDHCCSFFQFIDPDEIYMLRRTLKKKDIRLVKYEYLDQFNYDYRKIQPEQIGLNHVLMRILNHHLGVIITI